MAETQDTQARADNVGLAEGSSRPRTRRRRALAWALLATAMLGVVGTVAFTVGMERRARTSSNVALGLTTLEADAYAAGRAEDAALLGGPGTRATLARARGKLVGDVGVATSELAAGDRTAIRQAAGAYSAELAQVVAALARGDRQGALRIDRSSEDAAFGRLNARLERLATSQQARSRRDQTAADEGTLVALVAGLLLVAGIGAAGLRLRSGTDRLDGEQAGLRRSEATFRALVHESCDVLIVTDRSGAIRSAGPSVRALLGYEPTDLAGQSLADLIHPEDRNQLAGLFEHPARATSATRVEWRWRHTGGTWRWYEAAVRDLTSHPDVAGWVFNARDVTDRRRLEAELRDHALHDPLTGLANRSLFGDRLGRALAARPPQRPALLAIDLDGFKQINDTLGHAAGDRLLVVIADRLRAAVRPTDTVARLGGDEFAVLVEGLTDPAETERLAARIVEAVGEPVDADGEPLLVGASVGVAYAADASTAAMLSNQADAALYVAKAAGGRTWKWYRPDRDAAALDRRQLHADLRGALQRGEMVLHYQPIIDLPTGHMAGVEALLRWNRPGHGLVPPDVFIPLAEQNGTIIPIGRWVLEEAVRAVRGWGQAHPTHAGLYVSVNVSARQLHDPHLVDHTRNVLADTGLPPGQLILELTESLLAANTDQVATRLGELKELGVQLAVDDFGTGYSSLSYLRRFPIDIVKIDKSFVDGSESNPQSAALLAGVLTLGDSLHLRTLAEGVETGQQADTLRQLHCRLAQGFHFARPLPADQIDQLLYANAEQPFPDRDLSAPVASPAPPGARGVALGLGNQDGTVGHSSSGRRG
ncbi:MAG: putative bifunctional diguanylate cyclase/phosphodiesterase [Acidimicrobiales bacterium]